MSTYHHALVEPDAIHPVAFVGGTDPSGTPANNVAAHKLWIDTTGSTFKIKKRNATNDGWDIVASLTHADLTGLTTGDPHTQYLAKALGTVKGDVLVYNGSAWVALPAGTDGFLLAADSTAAEGVAWQSGDVLGAHVISDAGVDMTQEPVLDFVGFTLADVPGTPGVTRVTNAGIINPMTTQDDIIIGGAAGAPARLAKGSNGQSLGINGSGHLYWYTPAAPGTGTVTSVDVSVAPSGIFDVSGGPITGAGTIAISMDTQTANKVLASATSGGAATPAFRALVAADIPTNLRRMSIAFQFGDGTNAIDSSTEREQWLELNFDCTIEGHTLLADSVGSIVVDLWKDVYANYPPTNADSICAAAKPTLASTQKAQDSTLTGWTTALARGDILKVHIDSASTVKACTLTLRIIKT